MTHGRRNLITALLVTTATCISMTAAAGGDPQAAATSQPKVSIAIERAGGVSYTNASASDSDDSGSLTAFGIGGLAVNPYTAPRLGVDAILGSNLTLGGGLAVARYSLSSKSSGRSTDIGSALIYMLTPRVGYRILLSEKFDITPRAGLSLWGGSVSSGDNQSSGSLFALALGAEGICAYRATDSFNLLFGAAIDQTVSASVSNTSSSNSASSSRSTDIKGGLFSFQLYLGVGGYL